MYVVLTVVACLISFLSILAFLNAVLIYLGSLVGIESLSFDVSTYNNYISITMEMWLKGTNQVLYDKIASINIICSNNKNTYFVVIGELIVSYDFLQYYILTYGHIDSFSSPTLC